MASLGDYSEYQYLEEILEDAVIHKSRSSKMTPAKPNKYEKIKDIEMDNYKYNYHQQKQD